MGQQRNFIVKDTVIYMAAKVIEAIVGIIAVATYTYIFIAEQYGRYNILNLTIVTAAMVLVSWLAQAMMRYINEYTSIEQLDVFYSTAFFIWVKITTAAVSVASIAIITYSTFYNPEHRGLLWLSLVMFVTYGVMLVCTNILVARREVLLNFVVTVFGVTGKLMLSLLLIRLLGASLLWIILSNIIFDALATVVIVLKLSMVKHIKYKCYSNKLFDKFVLYGLPLAGLTLSTSILHNSDRYIIQILVGSSAVGIYYANYSLMSSGFSMLASAVMKGSYPSILTAWVEGNEAKTLELISYSVRHYLLISIPSLVGITVLAESISKVLLAPEYVEGYVVMKWVALGMVFLGLTEYTNKHWELSENTRVIFKNSIFSGLFNIVLNVLLIPICGYKVSAITTALGFLFYFYLSYYGSRKKFKLTLSVRVYANIIVSAIVMGIILKFLVDYFRPALIGIILLTMLGALVYAVLLTMLGELNYEISAIKAFMNKKSN